MSRSRSPLAAELRSHDRDRYQTTLFAPADCRDALVALYAFNYEIARIRESVREPMMGLMRLQWWRDALGEIYAGARPRHHDVVEPLAAAIRTHRLSQAHFTALLDARAHDLDETPPESLDALEAYATGSSASLVQLALAILSVDDPEPRAAGNAVGIAYALAGLLIAVPFHARMRRLYLPQALIARHGLDTDRTVFALKPSPRLAAIAREVAARARLRLDEARRHRGSVPRAALPALLPGVLAERRLQRLARFDHNVMDPQLATEDTLQSMRLARAVLRGRF
ncbi:MAG TPA: phytoene/squalene synthase family protein [Stellaceae bacterium]|nr:phytoene/squalene synthase family protein [Stellaceae bacterium]